LSGLNTSTRAPVVVGNTLGTDRTRSNMGKTVGQLRDTGVGGSHSICGLTLEDGGSGTIQGAGLRTGGTSCSGGEVISVPITGDEKSTSTGSGTDTGITSGTNGGGSTGSAVG